VVVLRLGRRVVEEVVATLRDLDRSPLVYVHR
jgi:hypothetical protein